MSPTAVQFARAVSWLFGWIYFSAWSLSFYPQPLLNIRRGSTVGTALDFPAINTLGFLFYLLSTALLYGSSTIRDDFAARHPTHPTPTVRGNDVAFAAHAVVLSALTLSMFSRRIWGLQQRAHQSISPPIAALGLVCVIGVLGCTAAVLFVGNGDASSWLWLDVVSTMGYSKLLITVVKYIPQVLANYRRQSTVGWSIGQILLDLTGGLLSIGQLLIDATLQGDWTSFTANPVKFGLGNVSILFDVIFMVQHYILYAPSRDGRTRSDKRRSESRRSLLAAEEGYGSDDA